jgi:hypothetical protein
VAAAPRAAVVSYGGPHAGTPPGATCAVCRRPGPTGSLAQGERDEWTFVAAAGDRVDITVNPTGDFDVVVDVLNDNGQSILASGEIDVSVGQEEIRNLIIPAAGEYSISVRGFENLNGDYQVSLSLSDAPEPGSILTAQDTLSAGSEHLFPFNSSRANVPVMAVVQSVGDFDAVLGIYDDSTDTLLQEIDESFTQETLAFTLPASGNYYFKVTGFATSSGTYNITLTAPPEVTLLLVNQDELTGSFDNTAQLDYYFRGNSGEIFTVAVTPDSAIDLVIEIYDADNLFEILAEIDANLSGQDEELTFTLPADGLYVIRIREFFGKPGVFVLTIQ